MSSQTLFTAADFEASALAYYKSLPPEHFMEATDQALQREIALASIRVLRTRRSGIRLYNEILFQWIEGDRIEKLVPDNALFLTDEPDDSPRKSFNFDLESDRPLLDMEWISESDLQKDRRGGATFEKNERLGVPYYLCFHRATQVFEIFHHNGQAYDRMQPGANGRYLIPEIDLELGLLGEWIRFWYKGDLLRLPDELALQLAQKDELLALKDEQLVSNAKELAFKDREIASKDAELASTAEVLASKDEQLMSKDEEIERLKQQLRRAQGL